MLHLKLTLGMGAGLEKKINQITNSMLIHALREIEEAVQLIIFFTFIICKYIHFSFQLFY